MENVRAGQSPQPDAPKIDAYVAGIRGEFEDRLGHMVEIPTVSMEPAHKARGDAVAGSFGVEATLDAACARLPVCRPQSFRLADP
jgi:predicted NUDIX family NTP pyrophosphohydrolase